VRNKKMLKLATLVVLAALILGSVGIHLGIVQDGTLTVGFGQKVITIGPATAYAAGTADYVCDGTDDDVQFQQALDALPSGGGRIAVLAGTYSFSNAVTRAIDNVTWEGVGRASYLTRDGVNPVIVLLQAGIIGYSRI
jgi:hypothetical protein